MDDLEQNVLEKKIVLLGPNEVGKTSLLFQLRKNKFIEKYVPTYGIDFNDKKIRINHEHSINYCIWDTNGDELQNPFFPTKSYQNTDAFILVWSYERQDSFKDLLEWVDFIKKKKSANINNIDINDGLIKVQKEIPIVIVVNKSDMNDLNKQFTLNELSLFIRAEHHELLICDITAHNNNRVNALFVHLGQKLLGIYNDNNQEFFFARNGLMLNNNPLQQSRCPTCC